MASGTLPATTVIARTSKAGERTARTRASASSRPGIGVDHDRLGLDHGRQVPARLFRVGCLPVYILRSLHRGGCGKAQVHAVSPCGGSSLRTTVQDLADTHTDVPSDATKDYWRYVPTAMIGNRRGATVRVAKPHMGTPAPYRHKPKCYKSANNLPRLEDWDRRRPASVQNIRLSSAEIGLYIRFAILDDHRYDLGKIAPKFVNILALAMCTRKARNMPDIEPCVRAALNNSRVSAL